MNREQILETAARAIHALNYATNYTPLDWDAVYRDHFRAEVRAAVEAILPQVTTVEELEALPDRSVLLAAGGDPFVMHSHELLGAGDLTYRCLAASADSGNSHVLLDVALRLWSPLTVVWRP